MWYLITRVTGIPPTEAQSLKSRGEAYRRYQQTTSPFFPWFRRSNSKTIG
jgi:steroid 5-alpha reductase family enzyme